jgi:hypothetical protein
MRRLEFLEKLEALGGAESLKQYGFEKQKPCRRLAARLL